MIEMICKSKRAWRSELWRRIRHACNLRWHWIGLCLGLKNIWRFKSAVWHFDTCDYAPMLKLLQIATREMAVQHLEAGHSKDSKNRGRELLIVSELCRRLYDDNYFENAGYGSTWGQKTGKQQRRVAVHAQYMEKQDADLLGKMFQMVRYWWD